MKQLLPEKSINTLFLHYRVNHPFHSSKEYVSVSLEKPLQFTVCCVSCAGVVRCLSLTNKIFSVIQLHQHRYDDTPAKPTLNQCNQQYCRLISFSLTDNLNFIWRTLQLSTDLYYRLINSTVTAGHVMNRELSSRDFNL